MTEKRVVGAGDAGGANRGNRGNRGNRSALALRSSIFGGPLSVRDELRFHKLVDWRDLVAEERRKQASESMAVLAENTRQNPNTSTNKKRSLHQIAAEAVAAQAVQAPVAQTELLSRAEPKKESPTDQADPRKESRRKQPVLKRSQRRSQPQEQQPVTSARPKMRAFSFYGKDQPLPALVPVRQLPSYSDQTDVSDLIDDGSNSDDGEWAGEFRNLLGSYAEKDFSKVDQQKNYKMQATGGGIFEAERRTLRLGIERDLEERRLLSRSEAGKERKGPRRRKDQLVLID